MSGIWDKLLHVESAFLLALFIFFGLRLLAARGRVALPESLLRVFAVSGAVSLGVLWEMGECFLDTSLGIDTQRGLENTMWDLIYDALGGALAVGVGSLYVRYSK